MVVLVFVLLLLRLTHLGKVESEEVEGVVEALEETGEETAPALILSFAPLHCTQVRAHKYFHDVHTI